MSKKIEAILKEKVDPILASHYGGAVLSKFDENEGIAYIKFTGACASCPSAHMTLEEVVKEIVMAETKDVKDVVLDTSVSDELIDMAKEILNRDKKM